MTEPAPFAFALRRYEPSDADRVAWLYFISARVLGSRDYSVEQVKAWAPAPATRESVQARVSDGRLTVVACGSDGQILAYGDLEPDGHIDHLYAMPEVSGRGVAPAVLERLIHEARDQGLGHLHVEASALARGLFERAGFVVLRRRDFQIGGVAIHNYAMVKTLRA